MQQLQRNVLAARALAMYFWSRRTSRAYLAKVVSATPPYRLPIVS
jgi:hypothetical protein